ncbi:hypothetical protein ACFWB0_02925 [Rhodococcus sp. NPDC060086]|uniref:hypothetical protein n=1 Tax=Rhodococcus sp. NPDC060086 TaxID=3347055 RepID=UPI00365E4EA7
MDLSDVLGAATRRERTAMEIPLELAAQTAREHGLKWSVGRWSDWEHGRVGLALPTVIAVAATLSSLRQLRGGPPVSVADLLATEGPVQVNEVLRFEPEELAGALVGGVASRWVEPEPRIGLAEERTARKLDIPIAQVVAAAQRLWGRTLTEERDARSGPGAQARGNVTRNLVGELVQELRRG